MELLSPGADFHHFIEYYFIEYLLDIDCCVHITRGTVSNSYMGLAVFAKDRTSLQSLIFLMQKIA